VGTRTDELWLQHRPDPEDAPVRVRLLPLPFRIGRAPELELVLTSPRVSKAHAEIDRTGRGYVIRDLGSRNGTFVNGERVTDERGLREGDVVHVAHRELTVVGSETDEARDLDDSTLTGTTQEADVSHHLDMRELYLVLVERRVRAVFQPIVRLASGARTADDIIGYEALGRHTLKDTQLDVGQLFRVAHERGQAAKLSRLMRATAIAEAAALPLPQARLFVNVHPSEMTPGTLLDELERAALAIAPKQLVAEIHESAVLDPTSMRVLRAELHARGIEIAYDDFGAGRARMMELAEVPPDFLKLDMALVRGIDASPSRQELVAAFVRVQRDAGVRVIAEGIETEAERRVCAELGCDLGQGYLLGRPAAASELSPR
jgi:EAL domain-containing protein (putative c-di-GMP-specific phosphodiesterase class I)